MAPGVRAGGGLGAVGEHVPVGSTNAIAARRIGARPDDPPPVEGY
jgi:hypothetical protein